MSFAEYSYCVFVPRAVARFEALLASGEPLDIDFEAEGVLVLELRCEGQDLPANLAKLFPIAEPRTVEIVANGEVLQVLERSQVPHVLAALDRVLAARAELVTAISELVDAGEDELARAGIVIAECTAGFEPPLEDRASSLAQCLVDLACGLREATRRSAPLVYGCFVCG